MNELISQIAQRTGIGEDKARQAAEIALNFFKTKMPGIGGQLDSFLQRGGSDTSQKIEEGLGGVFAKKSA